MKMPDDAGTAHNSATRAVAAAVITLVAATLLLAAPSAARAQRFQGGNDVVLVFCGFDTRAREEATVAADTLAVRIDSFDVPEGEFNVGDQMRVGVVVSASFGLERAPGDRVFSDGSLRIYIDGEEACSAPIAPWLGLVPQSRELSVDLFGFRPGSAEITVHAEVRGVVSTFPEEVGTARTEAIARLDVHEPYQVRLVPDSLEVPHGSPVAVVYWVDIKTMAPGELNGAIFDGDDLSGIPLPSVAKHMQQGIYTYRKSKVHEGCRYIPPHPGSVVLPFRPNRFAAVVELVGGRSYRQTQPLPVIEAYDYGILPECPEDTEYDPALCDCAPMDDDEEVRLISVEGTGGLFTPDGVDTRLVDPTDDVPPPPPPPPPGPRDVVDLTVAKSDLIDPVQGGDEVVYRVTVTNTGDATSAATTLTDALPGSVQFISASAGCSGIFDAVTCRVPPLGPGESIDFEIRVVTATVLFETSITNRASVPLDPNEEDGSDNEDSEETGIVPSPQPASCPLDVAPGGYGGDGGCGIGNSQVSCPAPDQLRIQSPTTTLLCEVTGFCGDNNNILGALGHTVNVFAEIGNVIRVEARNNNTGAQCTERLTLQGPGQ
jgi:uncharacterized repeat protein (TIGR01451 family)